MKTLPVILLWLCLTASAAAYNPPAWFWMPEDTRAERIEREKARLKWIRDKKILRAMAVADARQERVDERRASGYYIWLHYPHLVRYYGVHYRRRY